MTTQIYYNVTLQIFDMYGMTDIRADASNKVAQVSRNNGCWTLHMYYVDRVNLSELHEARTFINKQMTVEAAKAWVRYGR